MKANALLLTGPSGVSGADRFKKILEVLGVPLGQTTVAELLGGGGDEKVRVLGTAPAFLELVETLAKNPEAAGVWRNKVHSAFVVAGKDAGALEKLAQQIQIGRIVSPADPGGAWSVSDQWPEFCRSMSGVRVVDAQSGPAMVPAIEVAGTSAVKIISSANGAVFVRTEFHDVPVFLSTGDLIDVDAPLAGRVFDVRPHFLSAVPVVLYVKWAFADACWQPAETPACLVIDDPLLRRRYGFLNYQHLLNLMERVNFSTSIAFIPWNWNRSARKTVRLFQAHPERFSLSIHGCDHTGGEYGSRNRDRLAWKSRQAVQRMARHRAKTGVPHDHVMVFPQGVFSGAAMAALKQEEFIGVVNSEVISADPPARPVTVADYWDVAVMNYSDFPIFTRRYPWAGVENFAFDILLGKPCLVVVHHNDCHDGCRHVVAFMEKLNGLNAKLRWTNLAEVIRRSFRQREISPGIMAVEMYGSEVRVENLSAEKKLFRFSKRESAPAAIREIRVSGQAVNWSAAAGRVAFEFWLAPGESRTVTISFKEHAGDGFAGESLRYRVKAMVRRYLCEVRDNYIMRKSFSQ
ncbi:MAG: hypothetical protein P4N60_16140 [Verrucomicrobiae bacterium]|nr:hypothetical protein [Verrucomicrobiae bacterium]